MNLQSLIYPLGQAIEGSFESLLVPVSDGFNWLVILGGFIGLAIWLRMQSAYTAKAKQEGTLI